MSNLSGHRDLRENPVSIEPGVFHITLHRQLGILPPKPDQLLTFGLTQLIVTAGPSPPLLGAPVP